MNIQKNVLLKEHTYYEIGGPARYFIEAKNSEEVKKALEFAKDKNLPVFILGGGTNVLFPDEGFDGLALKLGADDRGIKTRTIADGKKEISVGAGVKLGKVVKTALDNNLAGLEWAAGIPGTVGGAVRGNAGAFGSSMADIFKSAQVIIPTDDPDTTAEPHGVHGTAEQGSGNGVNPLIKNSSSAKFSDSGSAKFSILKFSASEMGFGYRTSRVKKEGGVILEVVLGPLKEVGSDPEPLGRLRGKEVGNDSEPRIGNSASGQGIKEIKEEAKKHMEYRKDHQPYEKPSCGSVFKGVVISRSDLTEALREYDEKGKLVFRNLKDGRIKIPAGWLIEKADLKGRKIGNAQISQKHANFIVNTGEAKAKHVRELIELAKSKIKERFGVDLECEVELVE